MKREGVMMIFCFVGNKVNFFIAYLFRWYCCHIIHIRTNANYFKNGVESILRTRGMKGGLKIGDIWQEWMGMCPKVVVFEYHITNPTLHGLHIGIPSSACYIPYWAPSLFSPHMEPLFKSNTQPLLCFHHYPIARTSLHPPLSINMHYFLYVSPSLNIDSVT